MAAQVSNRPEASFAELAVPMDTVADMMSCLTCTPRPWLPVVVMDHPLAKNLQIRCKQHHNLDSNKQHYAYHEQTCKHLMGSCTCCDGWQYGLPCFIFCVVKRELARVQSCSQVTAKPLSPQMHLVISNIGQAKAQAKQFSTL